MKIKISKEDKKFIDELVNRKVHGPGIPFWITGDIFKLFKILRKISNQI